ncbi:MAG: ParB/RepB/Spo0J family partition protein [candidate division NC10 bacterium]
MAGGGIQDIPVEAIVPNPQQPRKDFEINALSQLAASLRQSGVIQPVVVRRAGQGYQLIVGERRWRAAKLAGLERIPAVVREATDAESLELALIENLLREDLNPIEEAEAYQKLLAQFAWTQEELAERVGKDRSSIANCLRLLKLPESIQGEGQVRVLLDSRAIEGTARVRGPQPRHLGVPGISR